MGSLSDESLMTAARLRYGAISLSIAVFAGDAFLVQHEAGAIGPATLSSQPGIGDVEATIHSIQAHYVASRPWGRWKLMHITFRRCAGLVTRRLDTLCENRRRLGPA